MSFVWTDAAGLEACLLEQAEDKYRIFNEGLIPGSRRTFGVRVPVLKEIAKDIAKGDWEDFLANCPDDYHEERILKGLVIGGVKCPLNKRIEYISDFVPLIDNWAVCDIFCGGLKEAKKRQDEYFELLGRYLESDREYELRFAVVMFLTYFIDNEYIDRVLEIYQSIEHEGYYVKMAVAWGLSVCYVKFPSKTLEVFKSGRLDDKTHNKAIQKCHESLRVKDDDKIMLNELKRKQPKLGHI